MTTDTDPRVAEAMRLAYSCMHAEGRGGNTKDETSELEAYLAAEFDKAPCIASDPRCPCNDGDTCNYVATKMTPAFEVPHPDVTQLISIADLLPTLSGADPAMLANVGHYLRGLSDRVKVLPVARTGPLRVAAEAVSAPVEAVPQDLFRTALKHCYNVMGPKTPPCCDGCRYEWAEALKTIREALGIKEGEYPAPLGATPHQAEPETTCNCRWQGEKLVKQCTLHEAHRDAIHEWARRAKDAEAGLQGYRDTVARLTAELQEVRKKLNTPELCDFAAGVVLEAAHQRERWGAEHDAGKDPADWFWLLGYLGGKVLYAMKAGDTDKALHHTISSAAALANWHAAISGADTSMRPGIDPVARGLTAAPEATNGSL